MSSIRADASKTEGLQFKPICRDVDEKGRRSHNGRSRGLPPCRSNNNNNNTNNNNSNSSGSRVSNRNKHRASQITGINGGRRYSGSSDDNNKTSNDNLLDSTAQDEVSDHHNYLRYNNRLSAARNSVDESSEFLGSGHTSFLNRRSSSVMRVRELRDVLTSMTSPQGEEEQQEMKGSQKARLLVASQQRLMSRLQDLSNQLESIDNEVTRVKGDIISSRRYFSAMTGIPYGPDWHTTRQMDSAYTSPTSCLSPDSSDENPSLSDTDWPPAPNIGTTSPPTPEVHAYGGNFRLNKREVYTNPVDNASTRHQSRQARPSHKLTPPPSSAPKPNPNINNRPLPRFSSPAASYRSRHGDQASCDYAYNQNILGLGDEKRVSRGDVQHQMERLAHLESPFKSLADFNEVGSSESGRESAGLMSGGPLMTRSDSCSSFMSWRSDQEMASLFPDEADIS